MKRKRNLVMAVVGLIGAALIGYGCWFLETADGERAADHSPFFEVFSEARHRSLSILPGNGIGSGVINADLYSFLGNYETYAPLAAGEAKQMRELLGQLVITASDDPSVQGGIGGIGSGFGFRKFSIHRLWYDDTLYLVVDGVIDGALYRVENRDAAEALEEYWSELEEKYLVPQWDHENLRIKNLRIQKIRWLYYHYRFYLYAVAVVGLVLVEVLIWYLFRRAERKRKKRDGAVQ